MSTVENPASRSGTEITRYLFRCGLSTGILVGLPEASIINWAEPIKSSASVSSSTGTRRISGRMLIGFWSLALVPGPAFCLRNCVLALVRASEPKAVSAPVR